MSPCLLLPGIANLSLGNTRQSAMDWSLSRMTAAEFSEHEYPCIFVTQEVETFNRPSASAFGVFSLHIRNFEFAFEIVGWCMGMHDCLSALGLSTNSQTAANATFQRCAGRNAIRPVPSLCALTTFSPSWLTYRQLCQLVTLKKQSTSATAKIVSPRSILNVLLFSDFNGY